MWSLDFWTVSTCTRLQVFAATKRKLTDRPQQAARRSSSPHHTLRLNTPSLRESGSTYTPTVNSAQTRYHESAYWALRSFRCQNFPRLLMIVFRNDNIPRRSCASLRHENVGRPHRKHFKRHDSPGRVIPTNSKCLQQSRGLSEVPTVDHWGLQIAGPSLVSAKAPRAWLACRPTRRDILTPLTFFAEVIFRSGSFLGSNIESIKVRYSAVDI